MVKHPPSAVDVDSAEAREEALVVKVRLSKLKLPAVKEVVAAQKKDTETVALREQLAILLDKRGAAQDLQSYDAKDTALPGPWCSASTRSEKEVC